MLRRPRSGRLEAWAANPLSRDAFKAARPRPSFEMPPSAALRMRSEQVTPPEDVLMPWCFRGDDGEAICQAVLTHRIHTETDLDAALAGLMKTAPCWKEAYALAGRPPLRKRADGFAGLAQIVVSQQLSTASARAIWGRLEAAFDPLDHTAILRARTPQLARAGLSAPKIKTLKAIAKTNEQGELDLPGLPHLPADEAHERLTAIHGIGPWTADIYLLFCLGHADAWPAGDLALQEAEQQIDVGG